MEITSKENKFYKELKKISENNTEWIFIEGKKLVDEAIQSNIFLEKILIDKKNVTDFFLQEKFKHKIIFVSNNLLSSLFTTVTKPSKENLVIGIAKKPVWDIHDLLKSKRNIILLDGIQDPGNLGTIIRSALAFNAGGVVLLNKTVDPFSTKVIRSSAGTVFKLPVLKHDNISQLISLFKKNSYKVIATSPKAKKTIKDLEQKSLFLILFGNEGRGLTKEMEQIASEVVSIPQSTNIESLNLGVAVSIVLWELYLQ